MIDQSIHNHFLDSLPSISFKEFFIKIFLIFFSVSLIIYTLHKPIVQFYSSNYYLSIIGSMYPTIIEHLFYITLIAILFYKFELGKLLRQLFPHKVNKSLTLFFTTLALILIIPFVIRLIGGLQIHPALNEATPNQVIEKLFNPLALLLLSGFLFIRAFIEEFIFRFVIFRFLRRKGLLISVIISTLLFSLLHQFGFVASINTFIFGALIALYYEYSNSFLKTVFLHLLNNLIFATPIISLIEYYLLKL
ncbi:hypothetical protein A3H85_02460 [Candidatus Daviesbacteria bacterium RIFCSPLOWO2_02_FULL_40_8]|uniref:CAAX prenyl protease 2/Lysostaphin resistance protein A-like domain-containing protein n=1 Tax=Candidatus Daviesbacteria bacterium RIFCSPLOWO2_01_FULL_40_24 TaxID=1797787 RepID=A0A1F5MIC5_9BACT|nr:MAG: hypothetical protein A2780_01180 [Candidatus Daviesbacteria bacterium RIFCSPHIGHO2_01_FULL_41_45]OGE33964.1 MAG: hypothetical protein A3C32_01150 [Candidatus Daviesbacteria bacterium RIFCSPHIGHO2_02_FULL_41_14]OGE65137.1 MAG: hypothetical protein A3B49_03145 [Candidatus Daviesbacteria bacterium RIFCSPLOWO2_01_FULL_40_24]OGE67009.1 MAG: hypothetical protein A3H85_02460 [Candidatus Daviesbacteria bacterium RIFCSPLOWO2_02_FULL_40_8]